jgi:hypothetical protein
VVNHRLIMRPAFAEEEEDLLLGAVHSLDTQLGDLQAEGFEAETSRTEVTSVYAIMNMKLGLPKVRCCGLYDSNRLGREVRKCTRRFWFH